MSGGWRWRSYDEEGYYLYYYYCADLSTYQGQAWLSLAAWALVNLLPLLVLSLLHNMISVRQVKSDIFSTLQSSLSGLVSHLHYSRPGSVSWRVSLANLLLTAAGVVATLWMTTAGFGPGDGRHLR